MWMLMNNIQKEIDTGAVNRSPKYAGEIRNALQDHNRQEEKQVYLITSTERDLISFYESDGRALKRTISFLN